MENEPTTLKGVFRFGGDSPAVSGGKGAAPGADNVDMHEAVVKKIKEVRLHFIFISHNLLGSSLKSFNVHDLGR